MTTMQGITSAARDAASRLPSTASLPSSSDLLEAIGLQYRRSNTEALISTLGAFLLGAVTGATLALLMAPRSGAETRARFGRQARELGAQAQDTAQRVGERARGMDERTGLS